MRKKIIVIGGGASGMVAAIAAARNGADVTIVEQKNELGKKILATGNGRCNFTNLNMSSDCYYSQDHALVQKFLQEYTPQVIIEFFESIGIVAKDRNGYVYPLTDQSSSIRDALVSEIKARRINVKVNTGVTRIEMKQDLYAVTMETQDDENTRCSTQEVHSIILSTGGKSGLTKQTKYHGYTLVQNTKHHISTLSPALVPLVGCGKFYKKLAGIRTDATVSAMINGTCYKSETGELQLTDYGVSGIPIFQISRIMTQALYSQSEKKAYDKLGIEIDFMPKYSLDKLEHIFIDRQQLLSDRDMMEFMKGIFKDKLASFLLYIARIDEHAKVSDVEEMELKRLARISKTFMVEIQDSKDFMQSQVTAGGISLLEVTDDLESRYHKNMYLTGEILDVDGICGGYNLHFAWATGLRAGSACSK